MTAEAGLTAPTAADVAAERLAAAEANARRRCRDGADLDTEIAAELGVSRDAYVSYRLVRAAIDRYHQPDRAQLTAGVEPLTALRDAADRALDSALALHRLAGGGRDCPAQVVEGHARRIVVQALAVKAHLYRLRDRQRSRGVEIEREEVDDLAR